MAWGIYKKDQGYWTRLMSAIGGGALTLAGASWAAAQFKDVHWFGIQESIYLMGGVGATIFIVAGAFIYFLVYHKPSTGEFLIATEGEMRKVHWSTRKEILGSTTVVIIIALTIAMILFGADALFALFFRIVGVLKTGTSEAIIL
ncbi:MAG: preprotein translocase subunit SecE [Phycisphaerales bacterium]|nr:preprotein translocase subunit SecE [Phycisphaerales bacterium]